VRQPSPGGKPGDLLKFCGAKGAGNAKSTFISARLQTAVVQDSLDCHASLAKTRRRKGTYWNTVFLKRGLQQSLYQRVLHFLFGTNRKKLFSDALARTQALHGVVG
jgi:hypothetical protein